MESLFTKEEMSFLKKLNSPIKIQGFLDALGYNKGRRISIIDVFRQRKADCLEAACFASYVFSLNNKKSFLVDLYCFDDDDHVICVFKENGLFGAVAQSKYLGLKYKSPVYRSLRELCMSYFEHYFNFKGELDLRKRSVPLKLPKKDGKWLKSSKFMYEFEERLEKSRHISLVPKKIKLPKISPLVFERETLVIPKNKKVGKEYLGALKKIRKI